MERAERLQTTEEEIEMMSDKTIARFVEYLKSVKGWTDAEIIAFLEYLTA